LSCIGARFFAGIDRAIAVGDCAADGGIFTGSYAVVEQKAQGSEVAGFGTGGKAGLVSVPRSSASAVCSALSSFASFGM
jgi:hypothetical protein